jgi:hypothetical protein
MIGHSLCLSNTTSIKVDRKRLLAGSPQLAILLDYGIPCYMVNNTRSAKKAPTGPPTNGPTIYGHIPMKDSCHPHPTILVRMRGPSSRAGLNPPPVNGPKQYINTAYVNPTSAGTSNPGMGTLWWVHTKMTKQSIPVPKASMKGAC